MFIRCIDVYVTNHLGTRRLYEINVTFSPN